MGLDAIQNTGIHECHFQPEYLRQFARSNSRYSSNHRQSLPNPHHPLAHGVSKYNSPNLVWPYPRYTCSCACFPHPSHRAIHPFQILNRNKTNQQTTSHLHAPCVQSLHASLHLNHTSSTSVLFLWRILGGSFLVCLRQR